MVAGTRRRSRDKCSSKGTRTIVRAIRNYCRHYEEETKRQAKRTCEPARGKIRVNSWLGQTVSREPTKIPNSLIKGRHACKLRTEKNEKNIKKVDDEEKKYIKKDSQMIDVEMPDANDWEHTKKKEKKKKEHVVWSADYGSCEILGVRNVWKRRSIISYLWFVTSWYT